MQKVTNATERLNYIEQRLQDQRRVAMEEVNKVQEALIEKGLANSFDLERLAQASAEVAVNAKAIYYLTSVRGKWHDLVVLTNFNEMLIEKACYQYKPNSTSNMSVELDLNQHFAWAKLANNLNLIQWRRLDDIAKDLGLEESKPAENEEDRICSICEGKSDFKLSDEGYCGPCFDAEEEEQRLQKESN